MTLHPSMVSKNHTPINSFMASYLDLKHVLLFFLFIFLKFEPTKAQNPNFLYQVCSRNRFAPNSTYQGQLRTLFSSLYSKVTGNTEFFNNTVTGRNPSDRVYGVFMCRGDIPSELCKECVGNVTQKLSTDTECSLSVEAVMWYDECMVRYSNRSFLSMVSVGPTSPGYVLASPTNMTDQDNFKRLLYQTMNRTADDAANSPIGAKKFATREANISIFQNLYCLAQCTPDLSRQQCRTCLSSLTNSDLPRCCAGTQGGRVLYPSCIIRFEIYPFYRSLPPTPTPAGLVPPPKSAENKKGKSRTIIIVVVSIVVSATFFTFCLYLLRRKARKKHKNLLLRENFGEESSILEGLQFELATVKAVTNNFSHENKLGKGGFGEVYKGTLPDGRHVAVKRLSTSSKQGSAEFKNEILLIAKLQHRNLVTFIGFCLEEQEKILIYEHVPNRSLDYFLFGTQQQKLNCNILLDENMNPKISDFGLARIVEIDQDRAETDRIVGTYGYMSPEYAMLGQFSEKSDVFSFGIIILEIVTGKKNINSYESQHIEEGLMTYVWRLWKDQTPLNILDPNIKENYYKIEVLRCIHIGLLCVQENPNARPTMAAVVSYLHNHSLELPSPHEPAFFMHGIDQKVVIQQGSSSSMSANSSAPFSVNEMSNSNFYPR
ncbi:hypothetical protein VNO77_12373 [Canavalia gladiata]|uniref:Cysteine-rich receptor-like protein kinase 25 n=1 Tax=Canavalia gladiata TaxID=3824 RepID=A0AAN9M0N0_CANGL